MARLLGPDANGRLVYGRSGGSFRSADGLVATVYAAATGGTLADIRTYDGTGTPGATIAGSTLTVDGDSQLPLFWFPDGGVDRVYVSVAGGTRMAVDADNNSRIDALLSQIGGAGAATLPLFNVETYGAVGDGTTDDYLAIKAAWDAMLTAGAGYLFFPRAAVYRIVADGRLTVGPDGQYALFPIPHLTDTTVSKKIFGILGVGDANVIRNYPGPGGTTAANVTASVLQVDYSAPFTWHATNGLPSVIGARDYDRASGHSNVHFVVDHLTIRQMPNPSMCSLNLEACSTAHIRDLYCDVSGALDNAPEPTNPTGAALLLPATGNAVQVRVDSFGAWGYYAGLGITEHCDTASAIIVRCKIALPIRRAASSHFAHITTASVEQCPWVIAGYDPSGVGPNLGVVAAPGWVVKIDFLDIEDFDAGGTLPWMYPGTAPKKAHIYDPGNVLKGSAHYGRVDSGALAEAQDSAYITGGNNFTVYKLSNPSQAVTRLVGGTPANPVVTPPNAPTIGTATGGNASASVAFTPAGTGAAATSYTATSTPGGITATGTSSPITVPGLTNGVAYTFKVKANNSAGSSTDSAASNPVTPASAGVTTYVSDTFTRADGPMGAAGTGQAWTANAGFSIVSSQAKYSGTTGGSYFTAVVDSGHADGVVEADFVLGPVGDQGLCLRYVDSDNYLMVDVSGGADAPASRTFERIGGAFTGVTTLTPLTGVVVNTPFKVRATKAGSTVTVEYDVGAGPVALGSFTTTLTASTKDGLISEGGQGNSRFDNFLITS